MGRREGYEEKMERFRSVCKKLYAECGTEAEAEAMQTLLEYESRVAKARRADKLAARRAGGDGGLPDAAGGFLRTGREHASPGGYDCFSGTGDVLCGLQGQLGRGRLR